MKTLRTFLEKNQNYAFFSLAFLLSWVVWIMSPIISPNDKGTQGIINLLGAYGPSLAAIILSVYNTSSKSFYSIVMSKTFFISFLVTFPLALLSAQPYFRASYHPASIIAMVLGSLTASFILSFLFQQKNEKSSISLFKKGVNLKWSLLALLLFPAAALISITADYLLGGEPPEILKSGDWIQYGYLVLLTTLANFSFGGSLNEELGWRGFAMPRLLSKHNPLLASLILGFLWTIWHAPLHFNGFYQGGTAALISRFAWNIPLTFFFTWLFIRTKGSIVVSLLFHTSVNTTMAVVPLSSRPLLIMELILGVLLITLLLLEPVWRKKHIFVDKGTVPVSTT